MLLKWKNTFTSQDRLYSIAHAIHLPEVNCLPITSNLWTCFPPSDWPSINTRLKQYKNLFSFFPKIVSWRPYSQVQICTIHVLSRHEYFTKFSDATTQWLQNSTIYKYLAGILLNVSFPHLPFVTQKLLVTAILVLDICHKHLWITPTACKNTLGNLLWSKPTSTHLLIRFH